MSQLQVESHYGHFMEWTIGWPMKLYQWERQLNDKQNENEGISSNDSFDNASCQL